VGNRFEILIALIESARTAPADQIAAMGVMGQNRTLSEDQSQLLLQKMEASGTIPSDPSRTFGFRPAKPYEQARAYGLLAQNSSLTKERGAKLGAKILELGLDPAGRPLEPELMPMVGHLPVGNKFPVNPLADEQVRAYGYLVQHPIWDWRDICWWIGKIEAARVSEGQQVLAIAFIARNPAYPLLPFLAFLEKVLELEGYPNFQAEAIAALAPSRHLTREIIWKLIDHVDRAGADRDPWNHMAPHSQAAAWGALGAHSQIHLEEDHRSLFDRIAAVETPLVYLKAIALGYLSRNPHLSRKLYREIMAMILSIDANAFIDSLGDHHPEASAYRREIFKFY
jgi:hypothetical protein